MHEIQQHGRGRRHVTTRLAGAALVAVAAVGTAASTSAVQANGPLEPGKLFPQAPITAEQPFRAVQKFAAPSLVAKYDVTTYGYDVARRGRDAAETGLGTSNVGNLQQQWVTPFANRGAMDATPVGLSNVATAAGPRDLIYVGNEHGAFGAIDANSGQIVWERNVGFQHTTCGDFPNGDAGVTGAATVDRAANRVYVVGGNGKLYALDLATGADSPGWTRATITARPGLNHVYGALTLDRAHHQIYATLASFCDHTPYRGQLVGVNTSSGAVRRWFVIKNKQNGGGIWGWGGASLDASGNPFVATGNALPNGSREATPYAEYVVKLGQSNLAVLGAHHPTLRGRDVDFGATPTLLHPRGCATPLLAVENKDGDFYIYRRNHLRAGPLQTLHLANGPAAHFFVGLPAYDRITRTLYVSNPDNGTGYTHGMVALRFNAGGCKTHKLWNTTAGPSASPVSSPVIANGVVYYSDGVGDRLHAFNATTGKELWHSASGDITGPVFSAPMVMNGRVFASSRGGGLHAFG